MVVLPSRVSLKGYDSPILYIYNKKSPYIRIKPAKELKTPKFGGSVRPTPFEATLGDELAVFESAPSTRLLDVLTTAFAGTVVVRISPEVMVSTPEVVKAAIPVLDADLKEVVVAGVCFVSSFPLPLPFPCSPPFPIEVVAGKPVVDADVPVG